MAEKIKFSQFPEVKEINSDSIFPAVQDGENVKITYENLAKGLGISDEKIGQAVETYLAENPVQTGATQEQAEQIEKNTEDISKITESLTEKEASGTADSKVSEHNTSETSHSDIRLLIEGLTTRLNALADSDDTTLDQMSEVVAYIKSNKTLIEAITTNKVSVSDIVDNLTTSASNKPLSAKQGVALKALIDAIVVPKKTSQLTNDSGFLTEHQDISGLAPKATTLSGYGITDGATKEQFNQLSKQIDDYHTSVKKYGAVGDGVTDDTQAFKNALAENDNVYVPKGNYLIKDTLDLTAKKSLYSDDGQRATIHFNGNSNIINIGRLSVFRNINIRIKNAFTGTVFNTHNHNINSNQGALESSVEHTNIYFEVVSPNATLIGITVDSGTDANNIPKMTGICYQTYHDIRIEYGCCTYGCGIKMELIQGRAFTEETKTGFPWMTHIDFDDIFLGSPYTAIKGGVTTASGVSHFERVNIGHILFNNISTQFRNTESTRYFLDVNNFGGFFTKCIGWDYHSLTWSGEKVNIIGDGVTACITDSQMAFGDDFLKCCDFTAETEYTVDDNPEYFINKYFSGTVLTQGFDGIDAKIKAKLSDEYIASVTDKKITDILYSGYANVLDDPLTQIKVKQRWSNSGQEWKDQSSTSENQKTTVIIPIVQGGNIIRWTPSTINCNTGSYEQMYFFNNDELTNSVSAGTYSDMWVSEGGYLLVDNPSGYKYVSIPFDYNEDINPDDMTMTINREITGNEGKSYTEYLKESVIDPAVNELVKDYAQPKGNYLTEHQDLSSYAKKSDAETWTFTLADGSTVTKKVVLG